MKQSKIILLLLVIVLVGCTNGFSPVVSSTGSSFGEAPPVVSPILPPGLPPVGVPSAVINAALGNLIHDGPATPEQISLFLPVTGSLSYAAMARVRYSDGTNWYEAHPLLRLRPEFSNSPGTVPAAFAGVITGLIPGRQYQVEVTVSLNDQLATRTLTTPTRLLPPAASAANIFISPTDTLSQIQAAFDAANAGDVIQFRNGIYTIDNLTMSRSGTVTNPIYIRGESRAGVRLVDKTNRIIYLVNASHLIFENMTLEGSGVDSGIASTSEGIRTWGGYDPSRITVRHITMIGVDKAVVGESQMSEFLVYNNTFNGNNIWRRDFLETNLSWNDDGIRVPGRGHAVFSNTLSGFGDSLAMSAGFANVGVHFYRNDVLYTCDDTYEGDYGTRNITFYDNRVHNAMTLASFDPVDSGPAYVFRNIAINIGRGPFKLNNTNTGILIYNNTLVRMPGTGSGAEWGWVQFNNGSLRNWAYRNNILLYYGTSSLLAIESSGNDVIDFTNNAWYPNGSVWWSNSGGSFSSLLAAVGVLPITTPIFSSSTHRHDFDMVSERNPFLAEVQFGATYDVQIQKFYTPTLSSASVLKNSGAAISGITDGFAGSSPDVGAVISGRPPAQYGDL